jgi:VWFA-related protein
MKRVSVTSLSGALSIFAGAALAAQEATPARSYDEELSVEVINVEVHVTDRKGRPVTGLARADFRLLEDGDPVEIEYFTEVGSATLSPPVEPPAAAAPSAAPGATTREVSNLIVYLDDAHMSPAGRKLVLADLRQALAAGTDRADRLMLVVFDGRVQILHPLTPDRQAVLATLEAMPDRATGGIFQTIERQHVVRAIQRVFDQWAPGPKFTLCFGETPACDCGWDDMQAVVREYAAAAAAYVDAAADGLSQITSALSGVEGRKAILYVSDGIEQRPGIDLFHFLSDLCPRYERELSANYLMNDQSPLLGRLTAHANANGVTFYPLEALGLQTTMDLSQVSHKFTASTLVQQIATANRQSPLFQLAADTGGLATVNANSFDSALEALGEDLRSHYSLGFTSRHRGDGKLHRLGVEVVGRRGLQVRHRTYYRDKKAETRLAERVWSTLLLGTGANPFGAELGVGAPRLHATGCCTVPVQIGLPLDRITLDDSARGRLYVVLTGRGERGNAIPVKGEEIVVEAAPGETAEASASRTLVIEVDLAPGPYELAVGLLDYQGGGEAFLRGSIDVVAPAESPPASR